MKYILMIHSFDDRCTYKFGPFDSEKEANEYLQDESHFTDIGTTTAIPEIYSLAE